MKDRRLVAVFFGDGGCDVEGMVMPASEVPRLIGDADVEVAVGRLCKGCS